MTAEPVAAVKRPPVRAVPTASLSPHPRNVREGDVGAIVTSLQTFGQYRPIVVQHRTPEGEERNVIVAGTHTWLAAQEAGMDKVEAVLLTIPDDLALRIMLADNRTHDLGRDRPDGLAELLVELGADGMFGTGYDAEDLDVILRDLGRNDPGAAILSEFAHLGDGLSERAQLEKGRSADGTEFFALHLSLTDVQRSVLLDAFKRAKDRGLSTQPEAIEQMARTYLEATNE